MADVVLKLHEQLKNLDIVWIKRLLVSIVAENQPSGDESTTQSLMSGKDTSGTVLLLREIFSPIMIITSCLLTSFPKHLMVSDMISVDDAPFRVVFLGATVHSWESSSVERVDLLSVEQRNTVIKHHRWMLTIQGHKPDKSLAHDHP